MSYDLVGMLTSGAALRISAASLDFEEITQELGVEPTFTAAAHLRKVVEDGEIVERAGPAVWMLESSRRDDDALASHLQDLIPYVLRGRDYLEHLNKVAKVEWYCWYDTRYHTGGVSLDAQTVASLGECRLPVGISIITRCDNAIDSLPESSGMGRQE